MKCVRILDIGRNLQQRLSEDNLPFQWIIPLDYCITPSINRNGPLTVVSTKRDRSYLNMGNS